MTINKKLITTYLLWFALLLIVGFLSLHLSTYESKVCNVKGYPPYFRWDSAWYMQIARRGYNFSLNKNSSIAFWPLFPGLIWLVHNLHVLPLQFISFSLNVIFSFLAFIFIFKLAKIDFTDEESFLVATLWLFFPDAYFLISGYPDALFAFLLAITLYFARRKKWFTAGLSSMLLAITKPYGVLIFLVLLLEYLWADNWQLKNLFKSKKWLPLCLPLVSFSGFVAFNYFKFKNALAFLEAQKTWGRSLSNPFTSLWFEFKDNFFLGRGILAGSHAPYLWYLFSFIFFVVAIIISWKMVRKTYLVFSATVMLTALLTGTLTSWGRYMFLAFPVLMGPALFLSKRKYATFVYFAFSVLLLLLISSFFVRCFPFE